MKNRLTRIISMLLILAFLVSCLTVFSFAETSEEEKENVKLIYYRGFDEGWDYTNGMNGGIKNNNFYIDYEEAKDFSYNYFVRIEELSGQDGFMEFRYGSNEPRTGGSVISFDIKSDDATSFGSPGTVVYLRTSGGTAGGKTTALAGISNGKLVLPNANGAHSSPYNVMADLDNDWIRVAYVFDLGTADNDPNADYRMCAGCLQRYHVSDCDPSSSCTNTKPNDGKECGTKLDKTKMLASISMRIYVGKASTFDTEGATDIGSKKLNDTVNLDTTKYYDTSICYNQGQAKAIDIIRFGLPNLSSQEAKDAAYGQSYCLDNMAMYNGESGMKVIPVENILDYGTEDKPYGDKINMSASKVVDILTNTGGKTNEQYVKEALMLKVGVKYGLYAEQRKAIITDNVTGLAYGAPIKSEGTVYVPFQAVLDYIGYPSFKHDDNMSYDFATDKGSALLTVGRDTATVNGELVALKSAPMMIADEETGKEYVVISLDDVETLFDGYYVTYDEMGLIIVSEKDELLNRDKDLQTMLDYMCKFIYDYLSGDEYYQRTKTNTNNFTHPYLHARQSNFDYYHQVYTNQVEDPLLKGYLDDIVNSVLNRNSSTSSRARGASDGDSGYDAFYYGWDAWLADDKTVDSTGAGTYLSGVTEKVVKVNESNGTTTVYYQNGAVLNPHDLETNAKKINGYVYESKYFNAAYDYDGGRLNESGNYNNFIKDLAFCYQVTRKEAFGRLAYEAALAMSKWTHWGQGHFLNCADATTPYAVAYDWMYNAWRDWGYDLTPIEDAIWRLGVNEGILVSGFGPTGTPYCSIPRRQGTAAFYTTMPNNWNAVCTSGMVTGALAILGIDYLVANDSNRETVDGVNVPLNVATMVKDCKTILQENTKTLANNGLGMYAPDGSYIESPNYWRYSTVSLFQMIWAITSATGDDSGFLNMWAMDKTFYFAVQCEFPSFIKTDTDRTQSTGYQFWNYHDSGQDYMDSCMFMYAADVLGQKALAAIRIQQLQRKGVTIYDVLAYKPEYANMNTTEAFEELELTYKFDSCDGIVSRDYFGDGCLYTGIMGNMNNASHAQIDSGNFIYANKNYVWFCDLGSENYNVYGYFSKDEYRYAYYRMTAEGNNVICLTSDNETVPWGQVLNGGGTLLDEYTDYNEFGMKAVIDNTTAYGTFATSCLRGMLFTNNRTTVVVQDEITFDGTHSFAWLAQTGAAIEISDDGRTAYLIKKIPKEFGGSEMVEEVIRCSIVSPDPRFTFSTKPATQSILNATIKPGESIEAGGVDEKDRSKYNRLAIESSGLKFSCAVVIETVDNKFITAEDKPVEYEWTIMRSWEISESFNATVVDENEITKAQLYDIKEYGDKANSYVLAGTAFSNRLYDFYYAMARASVSVATFMETLFLNEPALKESYLAYRVNEAKYAAFMKNVNANIMENMSVGVAIGGYQG